MCLAQGPQRSDASEARTRDPWSRVKHSTTEPLRSLKRMLYYRKINRFQVLVGMMNQPHTSQKSDQFHIFHDFRLHLLISHIYKVYCLIYNLNLTKSLHTHCNCQYLCQNSVDNYPVLKY